MKLKRSNTCCGCVSLLVGVELICLLSLIHDITILASVSSRGTFQVSTFNLSPTIQMLLGTWAFIGIPVAIAAGVAALYRIELPLRAYVMYMLASFFLLIGVPMYMLASGSLCDSVVTPEVQRMGSAFVCGFTDSLTFFWTLVFGAVDLYLVYVVWSAAEEVAEAPYPELMKYSEALKNVYVPDAPANYGYPMGSPRSAAFNGGPDTAMLMPSFGTAYGAFKPGGMPNGMPPTMGSMPGSTMMMAGAPQSFIPAPGSGFQ
mmetsp:Transcript_68253/g.108306  ORF Transcript_68253/g.108306 Transcript_68253/m.108306 type:complete len:260 (+) Transcript_68253:126-905(+)